jgi:hypothetical protein
MRTRFNNGAGGLICGPVFFLVAIWFAVGPDLLSMPLNEIKDIDKALISTKPRREILGNPPELFISATDKTCMDCHRIMFKPENPKTKGFMQHTHIRLSHAINSSCYDCHDKEERNLLVKRDGSNLTYDKVVQLCRQCHVSIYNAWTYGGHGRTNGYWNPDKGPQLRLECTECHNPHSPRTPAMDPMAPLPGPDTLRMGEQDPEGHGAHGAMTNPLLKAMLRDQNHDNGNDHGSEHGDKKGKQH